MSDRAPDYSLWGPPCERRKGDPPVAAEKPFGTDINEEEYIKRIACLTPCRRNLPRSVRGRIEVIEVVVISQPEDPPR